MTFLVNKFHIFKLLINSILISIALFQFSCGEKPEINISKTIMFEGQLYEMDKEEPFSGLVYNTYPDGQREYEGQYKDGDFSGQGTYTHASGDILKGEWSNGQPNGLAIFIIRSGKYAGDKFSVSGIIYIGHTYIIIIKIWITFS